MNGGDLEDILEMASDKRYKSASDMFTSMVARNRLNRTVAVDFGLRIDSCVFAHYLFVDLTKS